MSYDHSALIADARRTIQATAKTVQMTREAIHRVENDVERSRYAIESTCRMIARQDAAFPSRRQNGRPIPRTTEVRGTTPTQS